VFDIFLKKIVVIIVQSGSGPLYDLTVITAGVKMNKFVIRLHNGAIMRLFDRIGERFSVST